MLFQSIFLINTSNLFLKSIEQFSLKIDRSVSLKVVVTVSTVDHRCFIVVPLLTNTPLFGVTIVEFLNLEIEFFTFVYGYLQQKTSSYLILLRITIQNKYISSHVF